MKLADELHQETLIADESILSIAQELAPVDWVQVRLTARLSPAERVLRGMRAQAFAMSVYRGVLARKFPTLSLAELNMKTLAHFTPLRMGE